MNVVGIIAEYNPFHQGHAYQIEALKKICHAEHVVIAMSGNFVQRGAPALMEKYSRAAMALNCGADLVLELPALFATASAEAFARGGVFLLDCTGIVTHLGFGAETADMQLLSKLSRILLAQPSSYLESLQKSLRNGRSFPAARADALNAYFKNSIVSRETAFHGPNVSGGCFDKILASPNNILALEYLKALADLSSPMLLFPFCVRVADITTQNWVRVFALPLPFGHMSKKNFPHRQATAICILTSLPLPCQRQLLIS